MPGQLHLRNYFYLAKSIKEVLTELTVGASQRMGRRGGLQER